MLYFLFIPAVTVRSAGRECVFPHKVGHSAEFGHGVIKRTHRGDILVKSELLHQRADTAFAEFRLISAAVIILTKIHIP